MTENTCTHCGHPLTKLSWENEAITHVLVCNNALCPRFASPQGVIERKGLRLPKPSKRKERKMAGIHIPVGLMNSLQLAPGHSSDRGRRCPVYNGAE